MAIVYKVTNLVNGKRYIGKTMFSLTERRVQHECDARRVSQMYFHRALRKYGHDAFEWKVLLKDVDGEDLDSVEMAMIRLLKTKVPNGYNMTSGGDGTMGWSPSVETRVKMSTAKKGKILSAETRAKISAAQIGKVHSTKTRAKMSTAKKGRITWNKGKVLSTEHRVKISIASKNAWLKRKNLEIC